MSFLTSLVKIIDRYWEDEMDDFEIDFDIENDTKGNFKVDINSQTSIKNFLNICNDPFNKDCELMRNHIFYHIAVIKYHLRDEEDSI